MSMSLPRRNTSEFGGAGAGGADALAMHAENAELTREKAALSESLAEAEGKMMMAAEFGQQLAGSRRREFCHSAAPPSTFSRCLGRGCVINMTVSPDGYPQSGCSCWRRRTMSSARASWRPGR